MLLAPQKEQSEKLVFQRLEKPFNLAVCLRVSDRSPHMVYPGYCHQFLKGSRDKLAAVIGDDSLRHAENNKEALQLIVDPLSSWMKR